MAKSARQFDTNGWFEIRDNPLSKVGVFPYSGAQVGAPPEQANQIFRVLRPEEELNSPEAIASFRLQPIVDDHTMLGPGHTPAEEKGVHGVIGESVTYADGVLRANIKIFSDALAQKIKSGKTELSCGYRCTYEFTPGVWNGQEYDVVQRNLRGNHLALVDEGRMGPDIAVLDAMIFTVDAKESAPMAVDMNKLKEALMAVVAMLGAEEATPPVATPPATPPVKDGDATPPVATPPATPPVKTEDEEPVKTEDDDTKVPPATMDAALAQIATLKGQVAALAGRPALDEKTIIGNLADKSSLAERLSHHVGTFDHSRMTADEVAVYGVDKLKITGITKGHERVALDAYLQAKPKPVPAETVAADAKAPPVGGTLATFLKTPAGV